MPKVNKPTDEELYDSVIAAAKRKFPVYPSAYANMWVVREYKKRGGGYRVVNKPKTKTKGKKRATSKKKK